MEEWGREKSDRERGMKIVRERNESYREEWSERRGKNEEHEEKR